MPRIPVINTSHLDRIDELLVDNIDTGEFKLHRSVFTDEALFDLEMKYIFEGNWVYLAHESQIPNNNDYYTTYVGRQSGEDIFGDGVLEILQDGFGFLRSADSSYLAGP
ncbi:MAG: hypothetical protein E6588_19590, partial [Acinetobacter sp.]|nr:hypothetical protein [Acinetobacter sp.]